MAKARACPLRLGCCCPAALLAGRRPDFSLAERTANEVCIGAPFLPLVGRYLSAFGDFTPSNFKLQKGLMCSLSLTVFFRSPSRPLKGKRKFSARMMWERFCIVCALPMSGHSPVAIYHKLKPVSRCFSRLRQKN